MRVSSSRFVAPRPLIFPVKRSNEYGWAGRTTTRRQVVLAVSGVVLTFVFALLWSQQQQTTSSNKKKKPAAVASVDKKKPHQGFVKEGIIRNEIVEGRQDIILLNPNSTLANDSIESIWHSPTDRAVYIHFQPEKARCPRPALRGRLSGPALTVLHWTWIPGTMSSDDPHSSKDIAMMLKGTYNVPVSGRYFLEIVALFCNDWSHLGGGDDTKELNWKYNFTNTCMEDPTSHRITATGAAIDVDVLLVSEESNNVPGYWMWKKKGTRYRQSSKPYQPMYTRYQPQGCYRQEQEQEHGYYSYETPQCLEKNHYRWIQRLQISMDAVRRREQNDNDGPYYPTASSYRDMYVRVESYT